MSDDEQIVPGPSGATPGDLHPPADKLKYKSWRKKYRKMKAHFDQVLKENNASFIEEQKLETLNKRLQEQNDQLLDILLDLNDSLKIPKSLRYDLAFSSQPLHSSIDLPSANAEIAQMRAAVQSGDFLQAAYTTHRNNLESELSRADARKLSSLEARVPHPLPSAEDPGHVDISLNPEYLTTANAEAYIAALDEKMGDTHTLAPPIPAAASATPKFGDMTPRELEREIEMRNYHSVHNWLKRFNKENNAKDVADDASEAGTTVATPATAKKRGNNLAKKVGDRAVDRARGGGDKGAREEGSPASVGTADGDDDDAADSLLSIGTPTTVSKGKKGGDKDDTYRPKGGRSTKAKRKRDGDDSGTPTAKGKKARTSMAAAAAAAAASANS